jgi:hypothetical protein
MRWFETEWSEYFVFVERNQNISFLKPNIIKVILREPNAARKPRWGNACYIDNLVPEKAS